MNKNEMKLVVPSLSKNESFVRSVVAAFCVQVNPTLEEINDIKTAISEAVTNCVVHGYENGVGEIEIHTLLNDEGVTITIKDFGVGIKDVDKALQPFFTTKPTEERSGMGFTVIQAFMDELAVASEVGKGTTVVMKKIFKIEEAKKERDART